MMEHGPTCQISTRLAWLLRCFGEKKHNRPPVRALTRLAPPRRAQLGAFLTNSGRKRARFTSDPIKVNPNDSPLLLPGGFLLGTFQETHYGIQDNTTTLIRPPGSIRTPKSPLTRSHLIRSLSSEPAGTGRCPGPLVMQAAVSTSAGCGAVSIFLCSESKGKHTHKCAGHAPLHLWMLSVPRSR